MNLRHVIAHLATSSALVLLASPPMATAASAADASSWTVKPESSPVTFLATGKPGFLKIRGEGAKVEGQAQIKDGKLQGTFDVALTQLVTGIDLRDEHMREKYLETTKFPKARLEIDPLAVTENGLSDAPFTGRMTLKGVTKPVSGTISFQIAGDAATGTATLPLKLSEFPIGVPSHLGITVAESVEVKVDVVAAKAVDVASSKP